MEYEKCYVFEPEYNRSAKRRRINPQGLQASWKVRNEAYKEAWKTVEANIDVCTPFEMTLENANTSRRN